MKISKKAFYILALSGMITFSNVTLSSAYDFKLNIYKYGMRHSDVNAIQNKLKENGYLNISKTTNYYGSMTKSSVIKFQRSSGLKADGIVGKNTLGKLFKNSTSVSTSNNSESNTLNTTNLNIQKQTAANLNMRSGPSTSYKIKLTIPKGSKVNVISQSGKWSNIDYNGNTGYVFNSYLTSVSTSNNSESNTLNTTNLNIQKQTAANLNMRSGPNTSYKIKLTIPKGSKVNVISQSGKWSNINYNGNTGYVFNSYLTSVSESTNSSDNYTPNRGSDVSRENPVALDWSSGQHEIPRGSTFVVEDYKTGIKFNMKRTYGTNHADIEALAKEDTQKIKQIWGGFSWARRPVIVHTNDSKIIASMSAMPHAGRDDKPANTTVSNRSDGYGTGVNLDSVKGNGMNGVTDLHFLNSTRHSNKKQDSAHQNNIQYLKKIFTR